MEGDFASSSRQQKFQGTDIVEVIRSDLKFSAALRSRAGRMFKTVQPCGWCFVSVGAMGFYGPAWYLRTPSDAYASILFVFIIFSLELILLVQRSS